MLNGEETRGLVESIDFFRLDASRRLDPQRRAAMGQFLTPAATARLMASMFEAEADALMLLDPGAGVGSLTAAFVSEICGRARRPRSVHVVAYELDPALCVYLEGTLAQCRAACESCGVRFRSEVVQGDFIALASALLGGEMFAPVRRFNCVIMNPPYRKIATDSPERLALRAAGMETSNLYSGFAALALRLLAPGGEMVAITPRSFCNGTYFRPFRKDLLANLSLRRIHVFDSRRATFNDDGVLQENVIFHGVRGAQETATVLVSSSSGPEDAFVAMRPVPLAAVVRPGDPEAFIHIVPDELGAAVSARMASLASSLDELGLEVSTGRVVTFRAKSLLREQPAAGTVPLIHPGNFDRGFVRWPGAGKKPQALARVAGAEALLVPRGAYVLVKRFSSKEEKRRVTAAVYDPGRVGAGEAGFENHLNYFHRRGRGLDLKLAKGLAAYLNSSLVDMAFRQFSGHTQVNAGDLRKLRFPRRAQMEALGALIGRHFPEQTELDRLVEETLALKGESDTLDPVEANGKIGESLRILQALGLPRDQQNERSALSLLALLGLKPDAPWSGVSAPLIGITPMMEFFKAHYGKAYAPNSRETVRRQTVHQFLDAGMIVINPDEPERPTNSGKTVYQIERGLLELLRTWGTPAWEAGLGTYPRPT